MQPTNPIACCARSIHAAMAATFLCATSAIGQNPVLPEGFAYTRMPPANVSTWGQATCMAVAPDGRIYVAFQNGQLRTFAPGATADALVTTIPNINSNGEMGFIGLTLDPDFSSNRYIYCYVTKSVAQVGNRIVRLQLNAEGTAALDGSETLIFQVSTVAPGIHNGGALHFGPDGKLYAAVGEHGTGANAQNLANNLGKVLRINRDGTIPQDNPVSFSGAGATAKRQPTALWAIGLRNPFTFAFDPRCGRMFINDVGLGTYEEINEGFAGRNYGWPTTEGPFNPNAYPQFTLPITALHRTIAPTATVIAGGCFYAPAALHPFPGDFAGDYIFGDYIKQTLRRRDAETGQIIDFATATGAVVDVRLDVDGLVLMLTRTRLFRIDRAGSLPPVVVMHPQNRDVPACSDATLTVLASGSPDAPIYRWHRGNAALLESAKHQGTATATLTIKTFDGADVDQYWCSATNAAGGANSEKATLTLARPVACQPADIAFDDGSPLWPGAECVAGRVNGGVNEGDYNAFFMGFFKAAAHCDIADDAGNTPPSGPNGGVNEGDYNAFFLLFFNGCP